MDLNIICILYLAESKSLLLMDDFQVISYPHGVQVLGGAGSQLKGKLLKILKTIKEEHFIGRVNYLYALLGKNVGNSRFVRTTKHSPCIWYPQLCGMFGSPGPVS